MIGMLLLSSLLLQAPVPPPVVNPIPDMQQMSPSQIATMAAENALKDAITIKTQQIYIEQLKQRILELDAKLRILTPTEPKKP